MITYLYISEKNLPDFSITIKIILKSIFQHFQININIT